MTDPDSSQGPPRVSPRRGGGGYAGFFSSARTFELPVGSNIRRGEPAGYYIDFSRKPESPRWPPEWFARAPEGHLHCVPAQWGLGCFERYLSGHGEVWLAAAVDAGEYMLGRQEPAGRHSGGWLHRRPVHHTFDVEPPWLSAMAQGEGASLLARIHATTGEDRFAEAARRALEPLALSSGGGGVRAELDGGFFLEEYPTEPPSLVLNGGIFALWGYYDVAIALADSEAQREFEQGLEALAGNIHRWDTGRWSRYDLFPRRVVNVASSAYHLLHVNQLRAMQLVDPRPELEGAIQRFQSYMDSRLLRSEAFARKALFRLLVPRNRVLARRTPFAPS
jgi:heparosan-N-sulfate-glucuronate 5-epimerase